MSVSNRRQRHLLVYQMTSKMYMRAQSNRLLKSSNMLRTLLSKQQCIVAERNLFKAVEEMIMPI